MAFTDRQAAAKAKQIFDRFGRLIHEACVGTGVAESFLAGFTGVEAGIDHKGNIVPDAKRYEPGVYHHLIAVRDGLLSSYDHVTRRDLAGMTDDAIRNLATSWGCTQIMGWHMVHDLTGTVDDLRDLDKHFGYTVQLLKIVGGHYMRDGDLTSVLHIWNTGNANGKTYHEDYVANALKVKKAYEALIAADSFATVPAAEPAVPPTGPDLPTDETPASNGAPQPPASDPTPGIQQTADTIVNTGDTAPAPAPQDVTISTPAAMGTTATGTKITILGIAVPTFMVAAAQTVGGWIRDGYLDGKAIADAVLNLITANTKYIMMLLVALMGLLAVKKILRELVFLATVVSHMFPTLNNVTVVAPEPAAKRWWQFWK